MPGQLLVGTRKGLFTIERGGGRQSWRIADAAFLGDHVSMLLADPRDAARYVGLNHGHFGCKLHRSTEPGKWEEIAAPAYPEPPADAEPDRCPMRGIEIPWKLQQIWALEAGGPDQNGRLWCGTIPGGLFRSDDRGDSWTLVQSLWNDPLRKQWFGGGYDLPGIHSICVDPRNARHVRVGVSCGGAWFSEDDGQTWSLRAEGMFAAYMPPERQKEGAIQDPHRLVQCPNHPDGLWVQHHNGVFRSTDAGVSWKHVAGVQPSDFGFAVAVHPDDPETAWTVPAIKDEKRIPVDGRVVVSRTRDGGRTWEVLRNGLPQEHAYDLVYRHALDIDASGDVLAFGSTTGSLWATQDQGDHWHCVSANLPPVTCVRFGR
jgi:hypothetical protein